MADEISKNTLTYPTGIVNNIANVTFRIKFCIKTKILNVDF